MNAESKPPFFIIGSPRSGTTLLQTLIDAHPRIAVPPESHIFDHFSGLFQSYGNLSAAANLKSLVHDLLTDERIKRWGLTVTEDEFLGRLSKTPDLREIVSRLFECYAQKEGKTHWGDKTPEHTLYLREILQVFPKAQFIHIIRDGRDVAESLGRMFFGPVTIDKKAQLWHRYVSAFRDFKTHLDNQRYIEICYEDLVRNPQAKMNQIFSFLGEDPASLQHIPPDTGLKSIYLSSDDETHQSLKLPISDHKIGLFKKHLTPREIEIFESIARESLLCYGYQLMSSGQSGLRFYERMIFGLRQPFRFFTKWGHWGYLKDRLQFYRRHFMRSRRRGKR